MDKNIPDWRTQPEEYKEYVKEQAPVVIIESIQRQLAQKRIIKALEEEKVS